MPPSPLHRDLTLTIGAPAVTVPHHLVNQNAPPAANASRYPVSKNLLSRAASCPPFVPSIQPPSDTSPTTYASQKTHIAETPPGHAILEKEASKGCIMMEPDKELHMRYSHLPQRTMKKELLRRGLLCAGINADLARRLKLDDTFQAKARTAEDYDTMDPTEILRLCKCRFIPTKGTDLMRRDRLKAHDKRKYGIEAAGSRMSPLLLPRGPVSSLNKKSSQGMREEKRLVPIVKNGPNPVTGNAETIRQVAETVTPAMPEDDVGLKAIQHPLPHQIIQEEGNERRKSKRRCIHVVNSNEDPMKAIEPVIPRPAACKANGKDIIGLMFTDLASAVEGSVGTRVIRSCISTAKASASPIASTRAAQIQRIGQAAEMKYNAPKSRRSPLLYQPKDEITLLKICIKLKDVIAWGDISGFWNMVRDTLQLETGKPFEKVSRHVRLLVAKRRAEQEETEQQGKIAFSRVSAGCRPLLDKWIAGGNPVHHASPNTSSAPSMNGDKDDVSLDEGRLHLASDDSVLEVQKRAATDAWLDTSCDSTRGKKMKLDISELSFDTSKSNVDSFGCWSLSGSSVTSDSSVESEEHGKDTGKGGTCGGSA